jgi:LuxR family transcriptional regulator, maltose regulon positive regulatory protein
MRTTTNGRPLASQLRAGLPSPPSPPPEGTRALRLVPAPIGADARSRSSRVWCARPLREDRTLPRPRLVRGLLEPGAPPLTVLVAPAGFGKTTLLREWAARDKRPFAWVTLDARHDERAFLLASLEAALADVALADVGQPDGEASFVLVVEDAHVLHHPAARDALATVADQLPQAASLAVSSRTTPPLPIARLRAQHMVAELTAEDLALTRAEVAALCEAAGHELDRDEVDAAVRHTEGWPMGLSLALGLRGSSAATLTRFAGSDRRVAQYMREEVLPDLDAEAVEFLRRTSVADALTPSLCDALLRRSGSSATLTRLAAAGLLVPLDRKEDRYRYRRLLAEMLRAELRRVEPELERELHRRAAAWYWRIGVVERAAHHALRAGDIEAAARIACGSAAGDVAHGRVAGVESRLRWFTDDQIARHPRLSLVTALCHLARGNGHLAEHWTSAAITAGPLDEESVEIGVTLLGAALGRNGIARMRDDAAWARSLIPDSSPLQSVACLLAGIAHQLVGERDAAAALLDEAAHRAAVAAPSVHALCLSHLALLAFDDGDLERAGELSGRARAQVDRHSLAEDASAALVFATSALVRVARGSIPAATRDLRDASRLCRTLTDFPTWYRAELEAVLARAALRCADIGAAREHLADAARHVERIPDADGVHAWLGEARAQLDAFATADGASDLELTAAELRILQFLPSHHSFREIAGLAYVTPNTVKSHASSLYRKLDVNCRSDAVARARWCGLLQE